MRWASPGVEVGASMLEMSDGEHMRRREWVDLILVK